MKNRTTLVLGTCLSLASIGVFAQEPVEGDVEVSGGGYVGSDGLVVKTGLGDCLQTADFADDNIINKCEGIEDEVVEKVAVVEEVVEETPEPPQQVAKIDTREFSEMTLFDVNSATLNAEGENVIQNLFSALAEYKGITGISVTGHTDSTGTEAYNQALSEQRAATVAAEIATQYPGAQIDVQGEGESNPIASNDTAEGRQQNRRVDIDITATRMTFN